MEKRKSLSPTTVWTPEHPAHAELLDHLQYTTERKKKMTIVCRDYPSFTRLHCAKPNTSVKESSWNVMAHGDAREGKWRGNRWMQWVASTLHTTSEHGVSSITTADARTSAASIQLNWRPCRFKWNRPFCRKTKSGFCACGNTFQTQSNTYLKESCKMLPRFMLLLKF
jgi:hypothetical protein